VQQRTSAVPTAHLLRPGERVSSSVKAHSLILVWTVCITSIMAYGLKDPDSHKGGVLMQFILGVIFFVAVVGVLDARLPWPRSRPKKGVR
jgi:hypothetical protein